MRRKITKIMDDYRNKYTISYSYDEDGGSIPSLGLITIPNKYRSTDSNNYCFVLMHEIGHCETFEPKQNIVEKEFFATQWAIDNSKLYDVTISQSERDEWQDYIYTFVRDGDKSKYKLDWSGM